MRSWVVGAIPMATSASWVVAASTGALPSGIPTARGATTSTATAVSCTGTVTLSRTVVLAVV